MILLFVSKYKANARAIINILMYFSNALALTYFVLVGIALRALGPPAHSEGSSGYTHLDEDEQVKPHCRWKQKQAVWLIWVLLFTICLKAWAISETVKILASVLESRVVANLYFILFSNSINGVFMFKAFMQEKYALAINNVWLNITIMLTSLGLLSVYAIVLEKCRKTRTDSSQLTNIEGQTPARALQFYQIKGNPWAKASLFVLLITVLVIIALGTDVYSNMGTEVFNSFGHWSGSFFKNFLGPAMCIIPEKAVFLFQITRDPQGAVAPVVEGIKESASQIGLFFWFLLLTALLRQGHQASLYDNPWPALMVFVMTSLVQALKLEDNRWWKGALISLVGIVMLFLGVYRGYIIKVNPNWADYV
ncbi:hypothetical protein BDV11DRAFT_175049 [Aspergillus similis]